MTFFLNAARDAEVPVSPYILKNKKPRGASPTKRKVRTNGKPINDALPDVSENLPPKRKPEGESASIESQLLSKFPAFDPAWPDPIKTKWFEGYERLLAMGAKKSGGQ